MKSNGTCIGEFSSLFLELQQCITIPLTVYLQAPENADQQDLGLLTLACAVCTALPFLLLFCPLAVPSVAPTSCWWKWCNEVPLISCRNNF